MPPPAHIRKMRVSACTQKAPNIRCFLNDAWRTPSGATALPMASSHHFTLPRQVSARLTPLVWLCCLSHPSLVRNTRTVVSSMSDICRRRKGRFALNMKIKSAIIFLRADSDGHSLNPTIVEGPIGRHKSRLPSRETDDGLTGTYSRGTWTGPNRCWYGRESGVHVQAWGKPLDGTTVPRQALTAYSVRKSNI